MQRKKKNKEGRKEGKKRRKENTVADRERKRKNGYLIFEGGTDR